MRSRVAKGVAEVGSQPSIHEAQPIPERDPTQREDGIFLFSTSTKERKMA